MGFTKNEILHLYKNSGCLLWHLKLCVTTSCSLSAFFRSRTVQWHRPIEKYHCFKGPTEHSRFLYSSIEYVYIFKIHSSACIFILGAWSQVTVCAGFYIFPQASLVFSNPQKICQCECKCVLFSWLNKWQLNCYALTL